MLNYLPIELLFKITKYLSNSELLTCSEVCREWNTLFKTKITIRELELTSLNALRSAINATEQRYIDGNFITSLTTNNIPDIDCKIRAESISRLFPALKTINFAYLHVSSKDNLSTGRRLNTFKTWKTSLETLKVTGSPEELLLFFKECQFEQLTDLSLMVSYVFKFINLGRGSVIGHLRCLPKLKILAVNEKYLTFGNLELLHDICPLLEDLTIYYLSMSSWPNVISNITPTNTLARLCLNTQVTNSTILYHYIIQKYRSLTHLELFTHDVTEHGETEVLELILIPQLPETLASFKYYGSYVEKPLIDALDRAVTSQQLPNLTELFVRIPPSHHLNEENFLKYFLSKSIVSHHLTSLKLNWISLNEFDDCQKIVTKLTKFNGSSHGSTGSFVQYRPFIKIRYLDPVLDMHPLLKELTITDDHSQLDIRNGEAYRNKKFNITVLNIFVPSISTRVVRFIRDHMPALKSLSIQAPTPMIKKIPNIDDLTSYTQIDGDEDSTFNNILLLPNHYLESVNHPLPYKTIWCIFNHILCSIKDSLGIHYYLYNRRQSTVKCFGGDPTNINLKRDNPIYLFHIECRRIQHLIVDRTTIF